MVGTSSEPLAVEMGKQLDGDMADCVTEYEFGFVRMGLRTFMNCDAVVSLRERSVTSLRQAGSCLLRHEFAALDAGTCILHQRGFAITAAHGLSTAHAVERGLRGARTTICTCKLFHLVLHRRNP